MPPQIGEFISETIYDGCLNSNPQHLISNQFVACYFMDIPSQEERKGNSFVVSNVYSESVAFIKE